MNSQWPDPLDGAALAELFDRPRPLAFGLEEEIMVLDPGTLDLLPAASELLAGAGLDERFKTELPASQIEIATHTASNLEALEEELFAARRLLAERVEGKARLAVAGVHPFAPASGVLTAGDRYRPTLSEYGPVAKQQLVCGLHVHLGLTGSRLVLGVYNEMRTYLPEIAALAANAPVYGGRESSMASMRPLISGMLPRQGVPPSIPGWQWLADELSWGRASERLNRPGDWWWEMRPNIVTGTLEIRVPDAQTTVAQAIAVGALAIGLVLWVAEGIERDGPAEPVPSWRINENRWSAARSGVDGYLVNLRTGRREPTRDRLLALIETISPVAMDVVGDGLDRARKLVERSPAAQQREVMSRSGARGLTEWLADSFLEAPGSVS
jgi:glutamate---cysteine ligase / carboxylate-amine ligase